MLLPAPCTWVCDRRAGGAGTDSASRVLDRHALAVRLDRAARELGRCALVVRDDCDGALLARLRDGDLGAILAGLGGAAGELDGRASWRRYNRRSRRLHGDSGALLARRWLRNDDAHAFLARCWLRDGGDLGARFRRRIQQCTPACRGACIARQAGGGRISRRCAAPQ